MVDLSIYDVRGRLVRSLQSNAADVSGSVTWDGRNGAGMHVAAGTYFIRLTADGVTQTRKLIYIGGQ